MSRALGLLLMVALAWSPAADAQEALPPSDIVLLPLDNASGTDDLEWMRRGISRTLTRDLARSKLARVVSARRTEVELSRSGMLAGGLSDPQLVALGKALAASQVIVGAFSPPNSAGQVTLTLRILSTLTGRTLAGVQGITAVADPVPAARKLLADLLTRARFAGVTTNALSQLPAPPQEVLVAVHRALAAKLADPATARKQFLKASQIGPVAARQFTELVEAFPEARPSVLVLPVEGKGAIPKAWPELVQVTLARDLGTLGLGPPRAPAALSEHPRWTPELAAADGQRLQADLVVVSTVVIAGGTARIEAQLIASATGRVEATARGAGAELTVALAAVERAMGELLTLPYDKERVALLSSAPSAEALAASITSQQEAAAAPAIVQPRITRFDAVDDAAGSAASVLSWNAEDVDRCEIDGMGQVPVRGRRMVSPTTTTTYRLVCAAGARQVSAETEVTLDPVVEWQPAAFWTALAVAGAGGVLTVGGFVFATFPAAGANQLHGLALALPEGEERDAVRAQRDQLAIVANVGVAVAVVGAVLLVGGVVGLGVIEVVE
jgi:TolB-like protein